MGHRARKRGFGPGRPDRLEARGLLSAGLGVIQDLGEVSRALAIAGVEVTAAIAPEGAVTFRFRADAPGDYVLKVRYVGDGLGLEARGPSGAESPAAGLPGAVAAFDLPLRAASYEITASAIGGRGSFVDWELLLNAGVGQSAATAPALAVPPAALAAPTPTPPGPGPAATTTPAMASPAPSMSAVAPGWAGAASSSSSGGLVGRLGSVVAITPVGPTGPGGSVALAFGGDGLPEGFSGSSDAVDPTAGWEPSVALATAPTSLLTLGSPVDGGADADALAVPSWVDRIAGLHVATVAGPADDLEDAEVRPLAAAEEPGDREESASMVPGLVAGLVVVASTTRRWRPAFRAFAGRAGSPSIGTWASPSMGRVEGRGRPPTAPRPGRRARPGATAPG